MRLSRPALAAPSPRWSPCRAPSQPWPGPAAKQGVKGGCTTINGQEIPPSAGKCGSLTTELKRLQVVIAGKKLSQNGRLPTTQHGGVPGQGPSRLRPRPCTGPPAVATGPARAPCSSSRAQQSLPAQHQGDGPLAEHGQPSTSIPATRAGAVLPSTARTTQRHRKASPLNSASLTAMRLQSKASGGRARRQGGAVKAVKGHLWPRRHGLRLAGS